mgnify:CR=1 FL=1
MACAFRIHTRSSKAGASPAGSRPVGPWSAARLTAIYRAGVLEAPQRSRAAHSTAGRHGVRGVPPGDGEDADASRKSTGRHLARRAESTWTARSSFDQAAACSAASTDLAYAATAKIIPKARRACSRGAGWNVIKVIWGSKLGSRCWPADTTGLLRQRMEECVDGEYQDFGVEGRRVRARALLRQDTPNCSRDGRGHDATSRFGRLNRGGHDSVKGLYGLSGGCRNAQGQPTVILAKTVKGYGMGEAGEGRTSPSAEDDGRRRTAGVFRQPFRSDDSPMKTSTQLFHDAAGR